VSFEEGKTIFNDPLLFTFPDQEHSEHEERYINIGVSAGGNVIVLVSTERRGKFASLIAERLRAMKGDFMKKAIIKESLEDDEMRAEYDFSSMKGAVRGKYHKAYREGHKVVIHQAGGMATIHYFKLEEGAVMLEPDVRKHFSNSEAVNKALRSLISTTPRSTPTK
jgi:uncharacterized DUF497 family protein